MFLNRLFCNLDHLLESFSGGTNKEQIIRVSITSSIVIVDHATTARVPEELEEVVHIKVEKDWGNHRALADTVPDEKFLGESLFPSNICRLISIDAQKKSDNDWGHMSIQKLLEEQTVLNCVEGFGAIQETSIDSASIPEILIYCLIDHPRAERSIAKLLEPKLEVIVLQEVTIVEKNYPIQQFQYQ